MCPGLSFSCSWIRGEEPFGSINVRTETDAVVLMYRARSWGDADWKSVERRVPITWTACRLGGHRPWFVCGRYCGRRVAALYGAGELFACQHCCGLTYASQREALYFRDLEKAQKIRMRLGGSTVMSEAFPDKPKGMHWQTYERLRRAHDAADARSMMGVMLLMRSGPMGRRCLTQCQGPSGRLPCFSRTILPTSHSPLKTAYPFWPLST